MAERSPEPAKRWLFAQSASAMAAGRCRFKMSSRTSMAAESRPARRMDLKTRGTEEAENQQRQHQQHANEADGEDRSSARDDVGAGMLDGMDDAADDEDPGQDQEQGADAMRHLGDQAEHVEEDRQFELVGVAIAELACPSRP